VKRGGKTDGYFFNASSKLVGIVELKHTDMGQAVDDLRSYAQTALKHLPADDVQRLVGVAGVGTSIDSLQMKYFLYDSGFEDGEPQLLDVKLPKGQVLPPAAVYKLYEVR